ncbi:hypothetical protein [Sphingomonas bacterium]|uniref:hypothetical protein n=1 Tax=Sphingomonas bacterium TaxID=1895847 RepID=UPI0015755A28|nr:hypothetical protein [Sphingomonas bacterium]
MPSAYAQPFDPNRASKRRRAASLALTIAAHLLIFFFLLRLTPYLEPKKPEVRNPVSFQMIPDADNREKPKTQAKAVTKVKQATSGRVAHVTTPTPPPPAKNPPPPVDMSLFGDRSLFAASDVGKIHNAPSESEGSDEGSGKDSAAAYGPGAGPGGQRYYNVEWYREPSHAELVHYLPANAPPVGWGEIACRTIENYHVDNCRTIGESPLGSGYARSLREAAWQFLVRPPRIGGKRLVGSWVNIRITWTESGTEIH